MSKILKVIPLLVKETFLCVTTDVGNEADISSIILRCHGSFRLREAKDMKFHRNTRPQTFQCNPIAWRDFQQITMEPDFFTKTWPRTCNTPNHRMEWRFRNRKVHRPQWKWKKVNSGCLTGKDPLQSTGVSFSHFHHPCTQNPRWQNFFSIHILMSNRGMG